MLTAATLAANAVAAGTATAAVAVRTAVAPVTAAATVAAEVGAAAAAVAAQTTRIVAAFAVTGATQTVVMADVISLRVIARVRAAVLVPALPVLAVVRKDRIALSEMHLPAQVRMRAQAGGDLAQTHRQALLMTAGIAIREYAQRRRDSGTVHATGR